MANRITAQCEDCVFFDFDADYDDYICTQSLDEDELARRCRDGARSCPYFRFYNEYKSVQKQN